MIEIQNVSKRYGSVRALENVSLRMEGSGVLGLLGQNGAGKTTLINILTGYLAPTSGRALLDGHDPLMEPAEAKRRLGYLPEQPPLYDEMTVREYLRFVAALKGVAARAIPAHVGRGDGADGPDEHAPAPAGPSEQGVPPARGHGAGPVRGPGRAGAGRAHRGAGPPADHRDPHADPYPGKGPYHPVFLTHPERGCSSCATMW